MALKRKTFLLNQSTVLDKTSVKANKIFLFGIDRMDILQPKLQNGNYCSI